MKNVLIFILILAALIFGSRWMNTFRWHQRMTITIDTPAGEVSGSAVTSISWRKLGIIYSQGMGWDYHHRGEAVVVEVTPGEFLFALLRSDRNNQFIGSTAVGSISEREGRVLDRKLFAEVAGKRGRATGVIIAPDYQFPTLVSFTDLNDPKSVELVDPANLAARYGAGVHLKEITLEVTRESITVGQVEKILHWLPDSRPNLLDGERIHSLHAEYPLANSLSAYSFSTELTNAD